MVDAGYRLDLLARSGFQSSVPMLARPTARLHSATQCSHKNIMDKEFTPGSRAQWRAWLERNHDTWTVVWLVFYKVHSGKPSLSYNDAVEEAVCFGWIDGVRRSIDDERYTHRFTPRKPVSTWSAANRERAAKMIRDGLMTSAGHKAIRQAKRAGTWDAPAATIDISVPPELAEFMRTNEKAASFFESLAPSYRTQFTGWINSAKRPETRQRRLAESMDLLERGLKLGMH